MKDFDKGYELAAKGYSRSYVESMNCCETLKGFDQFFVDFCKWGGSEEDF